MIPKVINFVKFENLPKRTRMTLWVCGPVTIIGIFSVLCWAFGFENVLNILGKIFSIVGMLL